MKKFLIFIITAAAVYFIYDYFIKDKPALEIEANKVITTSNSMDIEAPALMPSHSGCVQGTVKNITDKVITDIALNYKLDGKPVEALVDRLEPGEQRNFSTPVISVRNAAVPFYLEEMSYK